MFREVQSSGVMYDGFLVVIYAVWRGVGFDEGRGAANVVVANSLG